MDILSCLYVATTWACVSAFPRRYFRWLLWSSGPLARLSREGIIATIFIGPLLYFLFPYAKHVPLWYWPIIAIVLINAGLGFFFALHPCNAPVKMKDHFDLAYSPNR